MQLESHATPPKESPQLRYAALHRAIERGLDSDELWRELAEVSLQIGHSDEAIRCVRRIRNKTLRTALESRLVRLGVVRVRAGQNHAAAPAASDAGPDDTSFDGDADEVHGPLRLQDHVADAIQFLCLQHMPWLVLLTTLAFPLVVGVGGFLTAGGSPLLLAAIAALPGLSVLAVVGAMGRQILLCSSEGSNDVPAVPELGQLVHDARRFLADAGLVLGSLIAPSLLALALGAPLSTALPGLLIGAFFTPIAWALRQVRGDYGSLSPVTLLRSVARCGLGYAGLVGICWALFLPAALVAWAVFGRPVWVQIAAVGPLGVLPLFVVSRLLGTWLETRRTELGNLLQATPKEPARAPAKPTAPADTEAPKARFPRRPDALQHFEAPKARPLAGRPQAAAKARTPQANGATKAPAAQAPATRAPSAKPTAATNGPARPRPQVAPRATPAAGSARPAAPATPKPAAKPQPRAIEGRSPQKPTADSPDLTQLPGAVVVSGKDRQRQGAAARPR